MHYAKEYAHGLMELITTDTNKPENLIIQLTTSDGFLVIWFQRFVPKGSNVPEFRLIQHTVKLTAEQQIAVADWAKTQTKSFNVELNPEFKVAANS